MSALNDALDQAQTAAIKALGNRFIRSADEPDPDSYRLQLHALGFSDDFGIEFLLTGWAILREERAELPAEPIASRKAPEQVVENRVWTSGKHRGVSLADTPVDYLEWAAESHPDPIGRAASQEELTRRAEGVPF